MSQPVGKIVRMRESMCSATEGRPEQPQLLGICAPEGRDGEALRPKVNKVTIALSDGTRRAGLAGVAEARKALHEAALRAQAPRAPGKAA